MKTYAIFLLMFLLIPLTYAETTFFDNSDDFFIMSPSITSSELTDGEIGEITGGTIKRGSCKYGWNCTDWGECLSSGKQIRNCINLGTCPDTYNNPKTEQNCIYSVPEIEKEGIKKLDEEIIFFCIISILTIVFIISYVKKDFFKKLIRKL